MSELRFGAVLGYRRWRITKDGLLISPVRLSEWPGRVVEAECPECPQIASEGCSCGLYASWLPSTYDGSVEGIVRGYGRVTEGSDGWRSQKAEIVALVRKPLTLWQALAETLRQMSILWIAIIVLSLVMGVAAAAVSPNLSAPAPLAIALVWVSLMDFVFFGLMTMLVAVKIRNRSRVQLADCYSGIPVYKSIEECIKNIGFGTEKNAREW